MKLGLEQRTGMKLETDMAILKWIIEWAPQVLNRCGIGADGNTAYKRRLGRTSRRPLVEIGEQVMAKPLRAKKTSRKVSFASKWKFRTWVGIAERTGDVDVAHKQKQKGKHLQLLPLHRWGLLRESVRQLRVSS